MIRLLTRRVLGSAAAAVDLMATAAVTAHAQRTVASRPRPHADRVRLLERLEERYRDAELSGFFAERSQIAPGVRRVRGFGRDGTVTDLSWTSAFSTLDLEVSARYASASENGVAVARRFQRGSRRPVVILVHGYMAGPFSFEERIWPLSRMDQAGFDVVLFTLPFHGLRVRAGRGAVPEFPGEDPRFNVEGFRQAIFDLQSLVAWLLAEGHPRVGVIGMSLGGYTAALLATAEPRLDFVVPVIPLSSLADFAREQGSLSPNPDEAAMQHRLLSSIYRRVDPVARPALVPPERCLVISAKADRVTPAAHARRLSVHLRAPLQSFYGGHLLQLGRAEAFERVIELMAAPRSAE
ncbi:MAG: abhydrolase domain-containing 18 [Myxococcales bacterium]|nr:MAG: abhydrolase domain-containing 18 [Myxococcales bacterium]